MGTCCTETVQLPPLPIVLPVHWSPLIWNWPAPGPAIETPATSPCGRTSTGTAVPTCPTSDTGHLTMAGTTGEAGSPNRSSPNNASGYPSQCCS